MFCYFTNTFYIIKVSQLLSCINCFIQKLFKTCVVLMFVHWSLFIWNTIFQHIRLMIWFDFHQIDFLKKIINSWIKVTVSLNLLSLVYLSDLLVSMELVLFLFLSLRLVLVIESDDWISLINANANIVSLHVTLNNSLISVEVLLLSECCLSSNRITRSPSIKLNDDPSNKIDLIWKSNVNSKNNTHSQNILWIPFGKCEMSVIFYVFVYYIKTNITTTITKLSERAISRVTSDLFDIASLTDCNIDS